MARVEVEGLIQDFGAQRVLHGITLDFPNGEFFGLLGPSGSGKTTLLRAIAGFVQPNGGSIRIGGQQVASMPVEEREIGMVFQNYALFPNMTVAENIAFGLRVRNIPAAEQAKRVAEALDLVQLGALGGRKPHALSGGQRQRVAMARAIVTRPRVLLLDEPLSALDKTLRVDMQVELKRIQREVGITTIFVTHDQEEAMTLSDRIGILKDGRLVQAGPPRDVYARPVDAFVATFLGEANLLPPALALTLGLPAASAIRPEALRLSLTPPPTGEPAVEAHILQRSFAGASAACILQLDGATWKAIGRDRDLPLAETGKVWASWAREDTLTIGA
jgi:putative spermidine/putrescine transport system ATP-binding protein